MLTAIFNFRILNFGNFKNLFPSWSKLKAKFYWAKFIHTGLNELKKK